MNRLILKWVAAASMFILCMSCSKAITVFTIEGNDSDLTQLLQKEGFKIHRLPSLDEIIDVAPEGGIVIFSGADYPDAPYVISSGQMKQIEAKDLKVFADFCALDSDETRMGKVEYERVVVTSEATGLNPMDLLSINCISFYKAAYNSGEVLRMVLARVAGFDKAEYGLTDTDVYPLVRAVSDGVFLSTARLVDFNRLRFMPENRWQTFWEAMISELSGREVHFSGWPMAVAPAYGRDDVLPATARTDAVRKGMEWFFNGHFLIHPSWKAEWVDKYYPNTVGPGLPDNLPDGDGTMGVLEGHTSAIYEDGMQGYRYFLRADVHGESAMAFAIAARLLGNDNYTTIAGNLLDYAFKTFSDGPRDDPKSPTYGLVGHNLNDRGCYYGDDNARFILGAAVCAALSGTDRWDSYIKRTIDGNFNTTATTGFRGSNLREPDIQKNGLAYYRNSGLINPHPHFESWMWACYLMQYARTGNRKYLTLAQNGISATMAVDPSDWNWTNGLQQEKARMVLPLAWLYRVSPTKEHLGWLMSMVNDLKANQDECGAIMEILGDASKGSFGTQTSNKAYGTNEAPLIFRNGDPVADMLYTSNFAVIGLHEAAYATGDPEIMAMCAKLCDFLIRIQARSDMYKSIDGAWYRAFNYGDWNYWASNADAGWGALGTLTGWTQSWIVTTLALQEMNQSAWDIILKDTKE